MKNRYQKLFKASARVLPRFAVASNYYSFCFSAEQVADTVQWQREHDGRTLLAGDLGQGLQVT